MADGNILKRLPPPGQDEQFDVLLERPGCKLERIVSRGHVTPANHWYEQTRGEWVVVVEGEASLRFEDETGDRRLGPGDYVYIAPHRRHRVTWTSPEHPTVWLALHVDE